VNRRTWRVVDLIRVSAMEVAALGAVLVCAVLLEVGAGKSV
jgi:hypothetical protein